MNQDEYRAAFDRVKLREGFREDTVDKLMHTAERHTKKEIVTMKPTRMIKTALIAAALAGVLAVSAAAAFLLLTPKDVAQQANDPGLAAAFDSAGAIPVNQHVDSEGYTFTLSGLVSGANLSSYASDLDPARTYAVLSVANTDGAPMEELDYSLQVSPLVSGYEPRFVSAWTLGGGYSSFLLDGVAYYLFDCNSLEMFADHTVYLAAGQNLSPGPETFTMAQDGTISFAGGFTGPRALFTLPLDASKADPDAVNQFLTDSGLLPPSPDASEADPNAGDELLTDSSLIP